MSAAPALHYLSRQALLGLRKEIETEVVERNLTRARKLSAEWDAKDLAKSAARSGGTSQEKCACSACRLGISGRSQ